MRVYNSDVVYTVVYARICNDNSMPVYLIVYVYVRILYVIGWVPLHYNSNALLCTSACDSLNTDVFM